MIYKNLTVKELYASIPNTLTISNMMKDGIEQGSTQLAVSAMEELIVRNAEQAIGDILGEAVKKGQLKIGTSMFSMIVRSLNENLRSKAAAKLLKALMENMDPSLVKEPQIDEQELRVLLHVTYSDSAKENGKIKMRPYVLGYRVDDEGNPIPDPDGDGDEPT